MNERDFVRKRVLLFPVLIIFFINIAKKSLQISLNSFFKLITHSPISKQAFSKARKKINPHTFTILNKKLVEEYYTDNEFPTWHSFRLLAVDGSNFQVPQTEDNINFYGTMKNQHGTALSMATLSYAYDVLSGLTIDAQIGVCKGAERDLFIKHVEEISNLKHDQVKNLYILDRGYPSLGLLFYLKNAGQDFLMRCKTSQCFSKVQKVFDDGIQDTIVRLYAREAKEKQCVELKKRVPTINLKEAYIDIRVVVVTLDTGEKELLLTSLGKKKYAYSIFQELYFKRWGAEENYKWHKQALQLENFSGHSKLAIEQDIFSLVLTANIASLLMEEAREELQEEGIAYKYEMKVNKRIAISSLRNELVDVLFNRHSDMATFCRRVKNEFKRYLCPIRPNRKYNRPKKWRLIRFGITNRPCI